VLPAHLDCPYETVATASHRRDRRRHAWHLEGTTEETGAIRIQKLIDERFVSLVRKGHPALQRGKMGLDRWLAASHVLVSPHGRPGSPIDDMLAKKGRSRTTAVVVQSFLAAAMLTAETDMVTTQPKMTIPRASFPKETPPDKGSRFEAKGPLGTQVTLQVLSVDDEQVTARVVHALAGKDLEFRVKVLAVRPPPPPVPTKPPETFLDVDPDSERAPPEEST